MKEYRLCFKSGKERIIKTEKTLEEIHELIVNDIIEANTEENIICWGEVEQVTMIKK